MATITSRETIQEMLDGDGVYPGDPQAALIYEYHNVLVDKVAWAVFWDYMAFDLPISPAVGEYKLLWSRDQGHVNPIGILECERVSCEEVANILESCFDEGARSAGGEIRRHHYYAHQQRGQTVAAAMERLANLLGIEWEEDDAISSNACR